MSNIADKINFDPDGNPIAEPALAGTAVSEEEAILKDILENLPPDADIEVHLPSKNKFYTLENEGDPITIRPMTFEDEKLLTRIKDKNIMINKLLSLCVKNININQLLMFDKIYLLLKIREISFGDEIKTETQCTNCGFDNVLTFNISTFNKNEVSDDLTDPREVTLPALNKTAVVRFPRVSDEQYLLNSDKIFDNVWRFVESIDGHANKSIVSKVLHKLPAKDVNVLMKEVFGTNYGIQMRGKYECDSCGETSVAEVQITDDFFTEK